MYKKVYCNDLILADKVKIANNFFKRFIGLMGKKSLAEGEGLLLWHCSSIHCFFMKIPIDAIYVSSDMTVLGKETIQPWHLGKHFKKTAHVLELGADTAYSKVSIGDKIYFK